MEILFDPTKRLVNILKHGFDFAELNVEFFLSATFVPGNQAGRLLAINRFEGVTVAVVFQPYGTEAAAVISMRHATPKERRLYDAQLYDEK